MIKILKEIVIIFLLLLAGLLIARVTPIPSSLISLFLFVLLLMSGIVKEEAFKGGLADLFLKHMAFFFLPPAVKLMASLYMLKGVWPRILLMMVVSNFLIMGVTGMVVQKLLKKEEEEADV